MFGRIVIDPLWRRLFFRDCGAHHWLLHLQGEPCITVTGSAVNHGLEATLTEETLHHVVANLFGNDAEALRVSDRIDRIPRRISSSFR